MDPISEEKFADLPPKDQMGIVYAYVLNTDKTVKEIKTTLRNKKKADTAKTLMGGIIGGAVVMATKIAFWK